MGVRPLGSDGAATAGGWSDAWVDVRGREPGWTCAEPGDAERLRAFVLLLYYILLLYYGGLYENYMKE